MAGTPPGVVTRDEERDLMAHAAAGALGVDMPSVRVCARRESPPRAE